MSAQYQAIKALFGQADDLRRLEGWVSSCQERPCVVEAGLAASRMRTAAALIEDTAAKRLRVLDDGRWRISP